MEKLNFAVLVLIVGPAMVATGCAGKSPGAPRPATDLRVSVNHPGTSGTVGATGAPPGGSSREVVPLGQQPQPKTAARTVAGAIESVGTKLVDAMTIKPKVIRADDPVSLNGKLPHLGPDMYVATARVKESQGQLDAAIEQYQRALKEDQQDLPALIGLARLYDRLGKFKQAEPLYRQAIAAHPRVAMVWNDLGLCLARQKQFTASVAAMRRAVELKPDQRRYRNNLAAVLVEADRPQEALVHLAAFDPEPIAHYNLAFLLSRHHNRRRAVEQLHVALRLDPSLHAARRLLTQLNAAPQSSRPQKNAPPQKPTVVAPAAAYRAVGTTPHQVGPPSQAYPPTATPGLVSSPSRTVRAAGPADPRAAGAPLRHLPAVRSGFSNNPR